MESRECHFKQGSYNQDFRVIRSHPSPLYDVLTRDHVAKRLLEEGSVNAKVEMYLLVIEAYSYCVIAERAKSNIRTIAEQCPRISQAQVAFNCIKFSRLL